MDWFYCTRIFTVTYGPGDIGMFTVNTSGVETMVDSIIALYFCWKLHLSADFYNLVMFSDIYVHIFHCYLKIGLSQWWSYVDSVVMTVIIL